MKIWELETDNNGYDALQRVDDDETDLPLFFEGNSIKDAWIPIKVKRMEPKKHAKLGDAIYFFTCPVFSEKALQVLHPLIKKSVEKLELDFNEKKYYAINVTAVLDVIDYTASKYKTFRDGKRIMRFEKYAFRNCPELIQHDIFKIVDLKRGAVFVSDRFKRLVDQSNLDGFKFTLAWDSEEVIEEAVETKKAEPLIPKENNAIKDYFSIVQPLTEETRMQINMLAKVAETLFQIDNVDDGKKVAEQIDQIVSNIIKTDDYPFQFRNIADVAVGLGTVLGQAVCSTYHWTWMEFGDENRMYQGLVSPNEYYTFAPIEYIYGLLSTSNTEEVDVTVALLFNMLMNIEDRPSSGRYMLIM